MITIIYKTKKFESFRRRGTFRGCQLKSVVSGVPEPPRKRGRYNNIKGLQKKVPGFRRGSRNPIFNLLKSLYLPGFRGSAPTGHRKPEPGPVPQGHPVPSPYGQPHPPDWSRATGRLPLPGRSIRSLLQIGRPWEIPRRAQMTETVVNPRQPCRGVEHGV